MANREYQMLFQLGARLNGNFSNTMSQAQKKLQTISKEIQSLSKTQSDVSGYQKQEQSIAQTNSRLELYKKQLENVRREMAQNGSENSALANKELELQERIRSTEASLVTKNERLAEMRRKLSEAGVNVDKLSDESARLSTQMDKLREEEEQAAEEAKKFGVSGAEAFEMVGGALVAAGITAALSKIAEEYKECVELSMQFGSTMSTVEALSGATVSEMKLLSAEAKQLGATTVYTANQSAEAMTYMGMAGWDASQMISGMDGVLNLAAASGENLALVSDIVTDNLTAFGLKASDTAHFADVLAAAATNSNTSVGIMGETFSGSASIAGALGYSIEDVSTAVGLMANAGVKGSVAGTALKNIFNGLLSGATLTSKAFGEVEYTSIKADGTMKSFSETCDELRGYFEKMTEAERVQNAMTIAGQRGYNGLLTILNATESDYQKLRDSIENCTGSAQKMANIKLDNLAGDVTLLDSATDGLKMTIGGLYEDELRGLTQATTEIIGKINEFCESNPAVVKALMSGVAMIGLVVAGYTSFNTAKKISTALKRLNTALIVKETAATVAQTAAIGSAAAAQTTLNTAMRLSPLGAMTAAIAGVTAVVGIVSAAIEDSKGKVEEYTQAAIEMNEAMETAEVDFRSSETEMQATVTSAEIYIDRLEEIQAATNGNVAENEEYHNILALIGRTIPELSDCIDLETNSIQGGTAALREYTKEWKRNAEEQARQNYINALYDEYGDVIAEAQENSIKLTQAQIQKNKLEEKEADIRERLNTLWAEAEKKSDAMCESEGWTLGVTEFLTDEYSELETALIKCQGEITLCQSTEDDLTAAIEKDNEAISEAKEVIQNAEDAIAALIDEEQENIDAAENSTNVYLAMSDVIATVTERTENLIKAYNDAYLAAYDSVSGQYTLWDEAAEISAISTNTINSNLQGQADYWSSYNTNLETLLSKSGQIDGLKDVIATFADGSVDSVNAIAGMALASDEDLEKMVENWQKVKEEQEKTAKALADTKVDFKTELDEIAEDMKDTVNDMNLAEDAKKAAEATIKAYADAIKAGQGSVSEAANIVSAAVTNSLGVASNSSNKTLAGGDYVRGFHEIDAYASGTDYANSGIALVGENGPELVCFRGGESVINADNTRAILSNSGGSGAVYNISPSFVINGNADRGMLEDFSAELVELINDTIDRRSADARRGAYV